MPGDGSSGVGGRPGVVVLGAGGFVGGAILRGLRRSRTLQPIAGLRRAGTMAPGTMAPRTMAPGIETPGIETRLVDARDPAAVGRALAGAGYAVNAVLGDAATMRAATQNLCDAARAQRLIRIVHISTISVYGAATGLVDEDAPLAADGSPYAAAKIECEAIIHRFVAEGGDAVILRPGIVYGPGGEQWVGRTARLLQATRIGDLGALGDGLCNLIHNDDLAAAAAAACTADGAAGHAFNLGEPEPPSWNQYFMALARAIGAVPVRRITGRWLRLETKLFAPPLQVAKLAGARFGVPAGVWPEPLPPSLLTLWQQRIKMDHRRADAVLGFTRTPWATGLAQSAAWFRGDRAMTAAGIAKDAAA